ncbi:putative protein kinase RLK-Pelle-LRR-XII-1 family [Helianthus annuus]|nr:putative protein kinase RLK-Pelle-LRR-XII-1 family [Helianthus annuus]
MLLFMTYLSIFLLLCPVTLAKNHTDHLALLSIKSTITLDPQNVLETWNASLHYCQWQGVTCGRRHLRVTKLDLGSRGIVGSLSPHIGNLSFLRVISIDNKTFNGVIPPQLGNLFRLQKLYLMNNSFEGQVPASLSNCTRLKDLWLSYNKLGGKFPHQLSSLVNLMNITFHNNNFTGGVPSFLVNLTSLISISAANNPLGGSIPHALGQLHNLQIIEFGINQLHGMIPPSLYNLTSLTTISFTHNQITGGLPKDIGLQLPKIETFDIIGNKFTGTIPFSFSNYSNLVELRLSENRFTGKTNINFSQMSNLTLLELSDNNLGSSQPDEMHSIDSMINRSNLERLLVHGNNLRGVLPSSIGNLSSQITLLAFSRNSIYGPLPSVIGNIENLEWLNIESNLLTCRIPSELGNLRNLIYLYLARNSFTGNFPDFIGNLSLLDQLWLSANRLEGQIPPNLGNYSKLKYLNLAKNNLTGPIPIELFQLSSLSVLVDLSHNHLLGPLPQDIGKLKSLTSLSLSHNHLVGPIPNAIGSCSSLENLDMKANSFQGPIPPTMITLRGVRNLDLSINNLSWQIPRFLEQLNLSCLNLSFNNLEGEVPIGGIFKNTSTFAVVGNSRLCGGLPELGLPKCAMSARSKKGLHVLPAILVVIVVCTYLIIAMVLSVLFCRKQRKTQTPPTGASFIQPVSRVSYGSILKATNEFSQQNLIGIGTFSKVYKGILEPDGAMVAIKILNLENQGALKSFMAECEALKNIRHRNLVKIVTSCSSVDFQGNEFKALIYEFMSNGNLERWLHPKYGVGNKMTKEGDIYSFGILLLEMMTGRRPTDPIFQLGLNLHGYVKMALPDRLMEIIEPALLCIHEAPNMNHGYSSNEARKLKRLEEIIISLARIGLACSMESHRERMDTRNIVHELHRVSELINVITSRGAGAVG